MNIPLPTYTDYEQGKHVFSLERACDFADEFDCTLDELVGRDHSPHVVTDPKRAELLDCWDACSEERRDTLLATAQDFATLERFHPAHPAISSEG
ncbi:hypothetical protein HMPREF1316_0492 [Olsenella profusa F0195]|uniref:HTH cro/C1-type domain-containing protein n=2 Tax=Olsenella profusa TaxID=138595 RepID=U2UUN2_9ACTN|nr:hypothetical protein HMPREF1316_0492 [Olsenella profusa F0195]